jgi:hypothetical protein
MPHTDDTVIRSHRPLGRHDDVGNIHIAQKIRCLVYRSSQFCVSCCITCSVNLIFKANTLITEYWACLSTCTQQKT